MRIRPCGMVKKVRARPPQVTPQPLSAMHSLSVHKTRMRWSNCFSYLISAALWAQIQHPQHRGVLASSSGQ